VQKGHARLAEDLAAFPLRAIPALAKGESKISTSPEQENETRKISGDGRCSGGLLNRLRGE